MLKMLQTDVGGPFTGGFTEDSWVSGLSVFPDGKRILVSSYYEQPSVGESLSVLSGGEGKASESALRIWDVDQGKVTGKFTTRNGWCLCSAMSPDSWLAATGHSDGTIWIWGLPGCSKPAVSQPGSAAAKHKPVAQTKPLHVPLPGQPQGSGQGAVDQGISRPQSDLGQVETAPTVPTPSGGADIPTIRLESTVGGHELFVTSFTHIPDGTTLRRASEILQLSGDGGDHPDGKRFLFTLDDLGTHNVDLFGPNGAFVRTLASVRSWKHGEYTRSGTKMAQTIEIPELARVADSSVDTHSKTGAPSAPSD